MYTKLPTLIFYPLLIIWSVLYGIVGGAIFKLVSVFENWMSINRYHIQLWKKYPQRSYQKYITNMWTYQIRGKPIELAEYTKLQIERRHPAEPFPLLRLFANTMLMLLISPFMMIMGMLEGPLYVFKKIQLKRSNAIVTVNN